MFYRFTAVRVIEAKTEKEARDIFAEESMDFAADATVNEYQDYREAATY